MTEQIYKLDKDHIQFIQAALFQAPDDGSMEVAIRQAKKRRRSLSQNALQHSIYAEISKYLKLKGEKYEYCSDKWVKAMLKNQFLGWELREFTDLVTGEVTTREELRETSKLDKGEACHYTTQILAWADSIGCQIKIPAKCEYRDVMDEQNN